MQTARRFAGMMLLLSLLASSAHAVTNFGSATDIDEVRQQFGASQAAFVFSGCLPGVPSSSLTLNAFACTALVKDASTPPKMIPVVQSAVTLVVPNSATVWLAIVTSAVGAAPSGWTREASKRTHFVYQATGSRPANPAGGLVFAKVTVAGGVITVVENFAHRSPVDAALRQHTVTQWGAVCDNSTNDTTAIQRAITAASIVHSTVVFPEGTCLTDALTIDADGVILRGTSPAHGYPAPGNSGSTLHASSAVTGSLLSFGTTAERMGQGIKDLALDLASSAGSAAVAVDMISSRYFRLDNVYITGTYPAANTQIGLRMRNGTHPYITDLKVNGGNRGVVVDAGNGESVNNLVIHRAWVSVVSDGLLINLTGTGQATQNVVTQLYCEAVTDCIVGTGSLFANWSFFGVGLDGVTGQFVNVLANTRALWAHGGGPDSLSEWTSNTTNTEQWNVIGRDFIQFPVVDTILGGNVVLGGGSTGAITRTLRNTATWNPASIADGGAESFDVSVANANAGTPCWAGFPMLVSAAGQNHMQISCSIYVAGTARVTISNHSGSPVDLDSGTVTVMAINTAVAP